uniref:Uncharacterized protein n=1 Tax=Physcomitrium patens TaxID=3218 RepID=A0A2K1J6S4_PHYPA|nr:hypothetical protein PHYPA_020334 [Physcomitrium patens]
MVMSKCSFRWLTILSLNPGIFEPSKMLSTYNARIILASGSTWTQLSLERRFSPYFTRNSLNF